jgi:hypothetical protein
VPDVRIDDPPTMNILGLFLAGTLRRNLVERGRACPLRGSLAVDAEGMRATVRFEEDGVTVTRKEGAELVRISGPLPALMNVLVRPGVRSLLQITVRGRRLFALRAMRYLRP